MNKKLCTSLACLLAASAFAQAQLGTVTSVNGIATVTMGTVGTAIGPGAPIVDGARVITTSSGSVTLRLNNGCTATVPPGSAVTVLASLSCDQLKAAIQPVSTTVGTTATGTTVTTVAAGSIFAAPSNAAIAGFAALLAVGAIAASGDDDDDDDNRPISGQ
jgi:hypothetical protein